MHKIIILLVAIVAHVARSAVDSKFDAGQSVKSDACQGPQGSYQPGERHCLDETTSRVCNWGGVWVEHKCEQNAKCQDIGNKKVQCLIHNHIDYPTGPPPGFDASGLVPVGGAQRRRRDDAAAKAAEPAKDAAGAAPQNDQAAKGPPAEKSDTCTGGKEGSYQPGERYCVDETTNRVCNWGGEWVEFKCEQGKCQDIGGRKVQCLVHEHIYYPTGPPPGFDASGLIPVGNGAIQRLRRDDTAAKAAEPAKDAAGAAPQSDQAAKGPPAEKSDTCTGGKEGSYQPGERYCVDETTNRVCNWGGEWVEFKCEQGKCQDIGGRKVQCLVHEHISYPTGPPPGFDASGLIPVGNGVVQRLRRDDTVAAAANAPKSDTCQGPSGAFQPGDRYCVDETMTRVCNWGGEWVDQKCDTGAKCQDLGSKRVQCLIHNHIYYPTGPPPGFVDADQPAAPANTNPQADSPKPVAPPPAQPEQPQQPQPQQPDQPQQPQPPQPSQPEKPEPAATAAAPTEPKDCQGGPSGTLKEGETFCTSETAYKQCRNGQLADDRCPDAAKCIKAKDINQVICREIRRNANQDQQQPPNETRRRF